MNFVKNSRPFKREKSKSPLFPAEKKNPDTIDMQELLLCLLGAGKRFPVKTCLQGREGKNH